MAVERLESERYPFLPVEVRIEDRAYRFEALIDTGFEGDLVVPERTVFEEPPHAYRQFAFADDTVIEPPVYFGTVRVGSYDAVPADVAVVGRGAILSRGIIDRYRLTLDHGERVIMEL